MRIRTKRELLIPVLNSVSGVVEKRQTLPILGNLLLKAGEESVSVVGTDLEAEVTSVFQAETDEVGEATIPARKFFDVCRALPEGADISVHLEKQRAVIIAGRSRFSLSTLPATDFPIMEQSEAYESFKIEPGAFKTLMDKTGFAMAHQDVRYYLNGLLLKVEETGITAVATDGHRLALAEDKTALELNREREVILPRKTVLELNRLCSGEGDPLAVDLSDRMIRVDFGGTVLSSKLVDGKYPSYERVIPRDANRKALLDRDAFKQSLLRASILSTEKYKGVRLTFERDLLKLQAHNPEQEEVEEELPISYQDETAAIGFNVGYLLDVLNVLEHEDVEMSFLNSDSSALIRNKGEEAQTYVVMPMRL